MIFSNSTGFFVGSIFVVAGAVLFKIYLNKRFYGSAFPIISLIKRMIDKKTRANALRELMYVILLVVFIFVGVYLIVKLNKILS